MYIDFLLQAKAQWKEQKIYSYIYMYPFELVKWESIRDRQKK